VFCCESECATTPTPTPGFDEFGRRVFEVASGQFILVVEGKPGISGRSVGTQLNAPGLDGRPDLQMQSDVPMGNGSFLVCDKEAPNAGGVPAVAPPRFDPADTPVTNALLDLACRFEAFTRSAPCTLVGPATFSFIEPAATAQFCYNVAASAAFPPGEAVLTVRLRDTGGETGPEQQIVVRVATPVPMMAPAGGGE
jgi:hypothetical protein